MASDAKNVSGLRHAEAKRIQTILPDAATGMGWILPGALKRVLAVARQSKLGSQFKRGWPLLYSFRAGRRSPCPRQAERAVGVPAIGYAQSRRWRLSGLSDSAGSAYFCRSLTTCQTRRFPPDSINRRSRLYPSLLCGCPDGVALEKGTDRYRCRLSKRISISGRLGMARLYRGCGQRIR